jgi:hypothetical protein
MTQIDFTELQEEVMNHWDEMGIEYLTQDHDSGTNLPPEGLASTNIMDWASDVLNDPMKCIQELEFESISSYIASKK